MKIFVDVDKTIFFTNGMNYSDSAPIEKNIQKVNDLFSSGHCIVMWTARGTLSNVSHFQTTYDQLKRFGVKFHELRMGKPAFDLLIDDKSINSVWDWTPRTVSMFTKKRDFSKYIIIIQARAGSSRLPNKVNMPFFNGKTILSIIHDRLVSNKFFIPVVVATTTNSGDDTIASSYNSFRGAEANVLSRYTHCARAFHKTQIIRICSDNPFLSLKYVENLICLHYDSGADYSTYTISGIPSVKTHCGLFCEVVSLSALERIRTDNTQFLENVTEYIYSNKEMFNVKMFEHDVLTSSLSNIRLTLDTQNDFDLLRNIYRHVVEELDTDIDVYKLLNYINEHPDIQHIMYEEKNKHEK